MPSSIMMRDTDSGTVPVSFLDLPEHIRYRIYHLADASSTKPLMAGNQIRRTYYHRRVASQIIPMRDYTPSSLLFSSQRVRRDFLECFRDVRFHIRVTWVLGPPELATILGRKKMAWLKCPSQSPVEVYHLCVDGIGILRLTVDIGPDPFDQYSVQVICRTNDAYSTDGQPELKWLIHTIGTTWFMFEHGIFVSRLEKRLHASIKERKGSGISIHEFEVIVSSIYEFVKLMEQRAHAIGRSRQAARIARETRKRIWASNRHKKQPELKPVLLEETGYRQPNHSPSKRTSKRLRKSPSQIGDDSAQVTEVSPLRPLSFADYPIYTDEDNRICRQRLYDLNAASAAAVAHNESASFDDLFNGSGPLDEGFATKSADYNPWRHEHASGYSQVVPPTSLLPGMSPPDDETMAYDLGLDEESNDETSQYFKH